jgi:hypothetical protein
VLFRSARSYEKDKINYFGYINSILQLPVQKSL